MMSSIIFLLVLIALPELGMLLFSNGHDLNFLLYTQSNSKDACDLQPTEKALKKCDFNPSVKTNVIVHGYITQLKPGSPIFALKDKILQAYDYNVVIFNWTHYSNTYYLTSDATLNYMTAASSAFFVSAALSSWMHFLKASAAADLNRFHLIGHSLGTEVVSYAAKLTSNIGHITYMDAAAPFFRYLPAFLQPSYSDAKFTDAIHVNGGSETSSALAFLKPLADIDYYPNGGEMQPECHYGHKYRTETGDLSLVNSTATQISCSHNACYDYYIASIDKSCKFLGLICDSYADFTSGKCSKENAPACQMGFHSKKQPGLPVKSKCYLNTSSTPPFCLN